jgi:hypothetical protein
MPTIYRSHLSIEPIDTGNLFTLVVIDSSSYFNYPSSPLLDVTIPGYTEPFTVPFKASLINTYNSATLGLNAFLGQDSLVGLPDGVWRFRYKICPYEQMFVERRYFRTTTLDERIKQIYNEIDFKECGNVSIDRLKNQVVRIHVLREGAKAVVEINERKACQDYEAALKIANDIIEKNCRQCKTL